MSGNTSLFTSEEHLILSSWLGVEPAEDTGAEQSVEKALVRLGFSKAGVYGRETAAVAAIVLDRVQERVPHCVTSMMTAGGSWEVVTSQSIRERHPRKLQLFPRLCLLKTPSAVETVAFPTGTGYRPWHARDPLSSPPFSTPRQLPWARSAPA